MQQHMLHILSWHHGYPKIISDATISECSSTTRFRSVHSESVCSQGGNHIHHMTFAASVSISYAIRTTPDGTQSIFLTKIAVHATVTVAWTAVNT